MYVEVHESSAIFSSMTHGEVVSSLGVPLLRKGVLPWFWVFPRFRGIPDELSRFGNTVSAWVRVPGNP